MGSVPADAMSAVVHFHATQVGLRSSYSELLTQRIAGRYKNLATPTAYDTYRPQE